MGKFNRVLLASDFDGTLKNDNGEIDGCVLEAVEYFKSEGGYFTLSTGRSVQGLCLYDLSVYNAPLLVANGAMAYDVNSKQCVFIDGIGTEGIDFVRDINRRFPALSIEMYPIDCTCAINLSDSTHRHFSCQGISYTVISDPLQSPLPWAKVMIGGTSDELRELQSYMSESYNDPSFLPTDGTIVEVLKRGVDKGSGLLKLADALGVSHEHTYSAGDGYNDREMLIAAHACFVPENGDENMKELASYIVRSNNDGAIANAIEILDTIY